MSEHPADLPEDVGQAKVRLREQVIEYLGRERTIFVREVEFRVVQADEPGTTGFHLVRVSDGTVYELDLQIVLRHIGWNPVTHPPSDVG